MSLKRENKIREKEKLYKGLKMIDLKNTDQVIQKWTTRKTFQLLVKSLSLQEMNQFVNSVT